MQFKFKKIESGFTYFIFVFFVIIINSCQTSFSNFQENEENEKYDGPDFAAKQLYEEMKDPATGKVPMDKFWAAIEYTNNLKQDFQNNRAIAGKTTALGTWIERGPNNDVVGSSNGNTRANNGVSSGRIRAFLVDAADATGNTVWVGGIDGGLWKATSINNTTAGWNFVNDKFNNLAISSICQDPTNYNTLYFCTGESYANSDAIRGVGVFKSTDHGASWVLLSNTTNYTKGSKILCDMLGNVYLATRTYGLLRSTDGGINWTSITPSGLSSDVMDIKLSSTGRLHISAGYFSTCNYRFTDNPATVTSGSWSSPATGFPTSAVRIELGCSGNTLLALPVDASYQVPTIYKSTDGGLNWVATGGQPTTNWASGQGWYSLAVDINATNTSQMMVGGLNAYRSIDGGNTWSQVSTWVGTTPVNQYIHADLHKILFYTASSQSRVLVASDGGLFYSSDGGTTWRDRNIGLRIKQFYSCAINPTSGSNILLAGAQDNGSHQFSTFGLGTTTEVSGGDGAYVHIDQLQPQYMYVSNPYNQYYRSTNTGASWTNVSLSNSAGRFINPTDYDNTNKIMYCADVAGSYRRWSNPQTGSTSTVVGITGLGTASVTAVAVSPFNPSSNTVFLGTNTGKLIKVNNANTAASGSAGVDLSAGLPSGTIHCIAFGKDSNTIVITYSNYGINNVWLSTNGGVSWTALDNNLPDMPVWWATFDPNNASQMLLGTETGIWTTGYLNGAATIWAVDPNFPNVSTQMLKIRTSDNLIAAATHGRGLWTNTFSAVGALPFVDFKINAQINEHQVTVNWSYISQRTGLVFQLETSENGNDFQSVKTITQNTTGVYSSVLPVENYFIRIKAKDSYGFVEYSKTIKIDAHSVLGFSINSIFPNPAITFLNISATIPQVENNISIQIINSLGQKVFQQKYINNSTNFNTELNVNNLNAGQYYIQINCGKEIKFLKFIKL